MSEQSKRDDLQVVVDELKDNMHVLEEKILKIKGKVKSGENIDVKELKAINEALRKANDLGAAW